MRILLDSRSACRRTSAQALAFAIVTLATSHFAPVSAQTFRLTQIPPLGGSPGGTNGYAINSLGQVTGSSSTATNAADAFIYSAGSMTDLGTAYGLVAIGRGINDAGEVVGSIADGLGQDTSYGFAYVNGTLIVLPTLTQPGQNGHTLSAARAINNSGVIVGYSQQVSGGPSFGVLYTNLALQVIPNVAAALSVNDLGQVAGDGYIYSNGIVTKPFPGSGWAINNAGQVAGQSPTIGPAFLYSNGAIQNLPQLPTATYSVPYGMNNAGQIVGIGDVNNASQPFFYSGGQVANLNSLIDPADPLAPYVSLVEARAINDSGWIVANGKDSRVMANYGYILTPESPFPSFVQVLVSSEPAEVGSPFTVAWTDQNVSSCIASGGGSGDGWSGSTLSTHGGQQQVTEATLGDYNFTITCTGATGPVMSVASVNAIPAPSIKLNASETSATTGKVFTLTWTSTTVTACTGSGGSTSDGWNGPRATSGSVSITESSPANYTYILTCRYGSQSVTADAKVSIVLPSAGGSGSFDSMMLWILLTLAARATLLRCKSF